MAPLWITVPLPFRVSITRPEPECPSAHGESHQPPVSPTRSHVIAPLPRRSGQQTSAAPIECGVDPDPLITAGPPATDVLLLRPWSDDRHSMAIE